MEKEFEGYVTKDGHFNKELYYEDIVKGANKIFTELFGKYSRSQVENIIQSHSIKHLLKSIFSKSSFSWIYFIEDKLRGLIKIGMTDDVPNRFSQFKTNYKFCGLQNDLKLIGLCATFHNPKPVEKYFHNMFCNYHNYMEWFKIDSSTLIELLQKYIFEKKYESRNINEVLVFLINDFNPERFKADFTNEMPMKRLDPFYENRVISLMEKNSLVEKDNKLYDIFMDELNEIPTECLNVTSKQLFEQIVDRIENKYLNLNKIFFEQVEKEKDVLFKIK